MNWLERYILVERVMADLDDEEEFDLADKLRDFLEPVWLGLSAEDKAYLNGRGMIDTAAAIDQVPPPSHCEMLWGPRSRHLVLYSQPRSERKAPRNSPRQTAISANNPWQMLGSARPSGNQAVLSKHKAQLGNPGGNKWRN